MASIMQYGIEFVNSSLSIDEVIDQKIHQHELIGSEDAFFVCDLGDVAQKYKDWIVNYPRVKPFYAVKCNDDMPLLEFLKALGTGFDCASKGEIQKVLSIGVAAERIIYANPCKQKAYVNYARKVGVSMMTFDNANELHKIKQNYPEAELVLRILPPATEKVQCILGNKFGCQPNQAEKLVQLAKKLELNLIGVSFHVGSGCYDAKAYRKAVEQARFVFDIAQSYGYEMSLLDVGGGFPGTESAKITNHEIAAELNPALDEMFPDSSGIRIISEPGRYFTASAYTLTTHIIAKRVVSEEEGHGEASIMYYVNDGVYGSFNSLLYDHAEVEPVVPAVYRKKQPVTNSSIWGPTCDGLDCIIKGFPMPELEDGDWIYFKDMGSYTLAAGSTFNGMTRPRIYYFAEVRYTSACDKRIAAKDQFNLRMMNVHCVSQAIKPIPHQRQALV